MLIEKSKVLSVRNRYLQESLHLLVYLAFALISLGASWYAASFMTQRSELQWQSLNGVGVMVILMALAMAWFIYHAAGEHSTKPG